MITVYYKPETGVIKSVSSNPNSYTESTRNLPTVTASFFPTPIRDFYVDLDSKEVFLRPTLPKFETSVLDLTTLPEDSIIRVQNEVGDYVEATPVDESITLTDPGTYKIIISAPFPYKKLEQEITIQ